MLSLRAESNLTEDKETIEGCEVKRRSPKGYPRIAVSNGRLQVHVTHKRKKHCVSLGLPDSPRARESAQKLCDRILDDVERFRFDESLNRYYDEFSTITRKSDKPEKSYLGCLSEIWERYTQFKIDSNQVEQTTIEIYYATVRSHISKLPTTSIKKAVEIRDYLLSQHGSSVAKKMLSAFSTACRWAYESELIKLNPFGKLARQIGNKKNKEDTDIDPFSTEEVSAILNTFYSHPLHSHYYNFVRFLFNTGCRTSEAIGLKWEDIDLENRKINFCRALVQTPKGHVEKGLKSQERRYFACNEAILEILLEQKAIARNEYVFPGKQAKHIVRNSFTESAWKGTKQKPGIVQLLANAGVIDHYRPQYQTRHTFITFALDEKLDVKDVARLVGNTPEIIYKHYAGRKQNLSVPVLH